MIKCKHEIQNGICEIHSSYSYCHLCDSENLCKGYEPKTNADWVRAMSDEQLANVIAVLTEKDECFREDFVDCIKCPLHSFCSECKPGFELEWLKQPIKET